MDFEAEGYSGTGIGTYTEYVRVGLAHTVTSATTTPNTVTVPTASVKNIGRGMTVVGAGISTGTKVESINRDSGVITLENPDGDSILTANGSVSVTFKRDAGENASSNFSTHALENLDDIEFGQDSLFIQDLMQGDLIKQLVLIILLLEIKLLFI